MKQYEMVSMKSPSRSAFDLSHEKKLSCNMGDLIPVLLQEVIPGDRFMVNTEMLVKFAPMTFPLMHRINAYIHYFFVPYRLIWDDWEDFITAGKTGTVEPNHPRFSDTMDNYKAEDTKWNVGKLSDYLGIPVDVIQSSSTNGVVEFSQLPFRAYQKIYNDYYRPQDLEVELTIPTDSVDLDAQGDDVIEVLRNSCWERDYFTSALPTALRGTDVLLPLTGNAYIEGVPYLADSGGALTGTLSGKGGGAGQIVDSSGLDSHFYQGGSDRAYADLSTATAATISELRRAFALQRWFEKSMRMGYRYGEQVLAHFGVYTDDLRIDRPKFLGGSSIPVMISEVNQTSEAVLKPLGSVAGKAYGAGTLMGFNQQFNEHGYVIGIMKILPRTAYQQGLPKIFSKFDKFDYYFPDFAHIGEQEVKNQELYLTGTAATDSATFGYQPRYIEYRANHDTVHGDFRTNMKNFHLSRTFTSLPSLNDEFVRTDDMTDVVNEVFPYAYQYCWVDLYHDIKAIRPIPKFGDPI